MPRRKGIRPKAGRTTESAGEKPLHPAYGAMKGLVRIMPGTDVMRPADPDWADRLDADYGPAHRDDGER